VADDSVKLFYQCESYATKPSPYSHPQCTCTTVSSHSFILHCIKRHNFVMASQFWNEIYVPYHHQFLFFFTFCFRMTHLYVLGTDNCAHTYPPLHTMYLYYFFTKVTINSPQCLFENFTTNDFTVLQISVTRFTFSYQKIVFNEIGSPYMNTNTVEYDIQPHVSPYFFFY